MKQRFQIGDPVEVSSTCRFHSEWEGEPLWIAAVEVSDHGDVALVYSTSEKWPPERGWTTDWNESDLSPRASNEDGPLKSRED